MADANGSGLRKQASSRKWADRSPESKAAHARAANLRKKVVVGVCAYCAAPFERVRSRSAGRYTKYCSQSCNGRHRVEMGLTPPHPDPSLARLRKSRDAARRYFARLALWAGRQVKRKIAEWHIREHGNAITCVACQALFCRTDGRRWLTTCSDECQRELLRRQRLKQRRSPAGRASKALHRARRKRRESSAGEAVDPYKVFARDGWRCYLCGIDTPRKLRGKNLPNSPELDHVIPLARGGQHVESNLRCACRKCNGVKGHRPLSLLHTATVHLIHHPA